jgi:hypothetical protein
VQPADGRAIFFVVEADRCPAVRHRTASPRWAALDLIGQVTFLADAPAAFNSTGRVLGKTVIRVVE